MKRIIGLAALLATIVVATLAPLANAQCVTGTGTNVLFKWDANGFSYEGPGAYTNYVSPAGNVLNNLAAATLLCGPLAGLDPNDPAKEYGDHLHTYTASNPYRTVAVLSIQKFELSYYHLTHRLTTRFPHQLQHLPLRQSLLQRLHLVQHPVQHSPYHW